MAQLAEGKLDQKSASDRLGVTVRQIKRLKRNYLSNGIAGLISKKRGQLSNRRIPESLIANAMSLIGVHYADFGPTFAAEKLAEQHGISLSVETVRKHMIASGYWKPKRGQIIRNHPMRERRPRRGELIQIDGSPHDWFEGRSPSCCLLVFIDDATSELTELQFVDTETTLGYMACLERHIYRHGLPAALYSDRHSIFRINNGDVKADAQTQFARALSQLGIEGIQARSPQAKGRVERANQTLQDRLVKEMRLAGINDQASANAWLPGFMADYNHRFGVQPDQADDAHIAYLGKSDALQRILSVHDQRYLSKNLSCQHDGQLLQINTTGASLSLRGAKVCVHSHSDGRKEVSWQGRNLIFATMIKPEKQSTPKDGKEVNTIVDLVLKTRPSTLPSKKHPWKSPPLSAAEKQAQVVAQFNQPKNNMPIQPASP